MNPRVLHSDNRVSGIALCLMGCALICARPDIARCEFADVSIKATTPISKSAPRRKSVSAETELAIAFDQDYLLHVGNNEGRNLADGMTVYFLRRELQALVDMWRATGNRSYLDCATDLALQAIDAAKANCQPLIWHGEVRGQWPCFYLSSVASETGGHNQLCDFQGAVGFMMVARALRQANDPTARDIAAFVHSDVVEKWLYYKPSMTLWHMQNENSFDNALAALNTGRDVREHFACLCLDLNRLGFRKYAYRTWAKRLLDLYLTVRYDLDEPAPNSAGIEDLIPDNWGLFAQQADEGYTWLLIPDYTDNGLTSGVDTSHGNRTAWLAARAYSEGLLDADVLYGLINTLKFRIWTSEKGMYYFNNFTDGTDSEFNGLAPGRGGNVWFGWHRLSTYDAELETLFIALAYDLAVGGPNLPDYAQNKTMANAPLCLEAWGARLLSGDGRPHVFP